MENTSLPYINPRKWSSFFLFFFGTTRMHFRGKTVSANGLVRKTPGTLKLYYWAGCGRNTWPLGQRASMFTSVNTSAICNALYIISQNEPRLCTLTDCIYPWCCRLQNTIQQNNSYTLYPVTESRWFVLLVPEDKSHTLCTSLHPTRTAHRWQLSILEGHSVSRKKETKIYVTNTVNKNKEQTTQQLRQTYSFTTANFPFL